MFLANLPEEQKKAFLSLAQAMISADGVLNEDETEMMEQYRKEMALPAGETEAQPVESVMAAFKGASAGVKKQIVFELLALAYVDNDYAEQEKRMLEKVVREFDLDGKFLDKCKPCVVELVDLYERIEQLVGK